MNEKKCRAIVNARCEGFCEVCGMSGYLTHHHRKKKGQGGPWSPENILAVDGSGTTGCHGRIEANPNWAEERGYHVRPWQDPAEIPVNYRGHKALLLSDGAIQYV